MVIELVGGLTLVSIGVSLFRVMRKAVGKSTGLPYNLVTAGSIREELNPHFFLRWATVGAALIANATNFGILGLVLFGLVHWASTWG